MDLFWALFSIYFGQFITKIFDISFFYIISLILYPFGVINKFSNDNHGTPEMEYLNYYISTNCWTMYKKPVHVSEQSFYKGIDEHKNIPQFTQMIDGGFFYKEFFKDKQKIKIWGYANICDGQIVGMSGNNYYKKKEFYIFSTNDTNILDFINMIRDTYIQKQKQKGLVYKFSICPGGAWPWWSGRIFPAAKLDTYTLSPEMTQFKDDLSLFINSRDRYNKMSRPYKMSSLIHGPPGTGKSRFIKSLAYHFDIPIMEVNLATGKIDDEGMKFLLKLSGTGLRIILLDEFDTIKHQVKTKSMTGNDDKKESMKDLSKAGWNNLLDCEAYDSLIVVCVTNLNLEQLRQLYDDSFLRDGRFDGKYYFGNATSDMIRNYLELKGIDIKDDQLIDNLDKKHPMVTYQTIIDKYMDMDKIYVRLQKLHTDIKVNNWDSGEVSELLNKNGLSEYNELFYKRKIKKIDQFVLCSEGHLKGDFGIPLGDTLLIMSVINIERERIAKEKKEKEEKEKEEKEKEEKEKEEKEKKEKEEKDKEEKDKEEKDKEEKDKECSDDNEIILDDPKFKKGVSKDDINVFFKTTRLNKAKINAEK